MGKVVKGVLGVASIAASFIPGIGPVAAAGLRLVGSSLASSALAPKKPKAPDAAPTVARGFTEGITYDQNAARRVGYGRFATNGLSVFERVYGADDSIKSRVLAQSDCGPIEGVTQILLNETEVSLDGSGYVTTAPWDNGAVRIVVDPGAASGNNFADLVSAGVGWTNDHLGKRVAKAWVQFTANDTAFADGEPEILFVCEGAKVYDPRQDSSIGGSGDHRFDDPDTWTWGAHAETPALQALHYILGMYEGGRRLWGVGTPPELIDFAAFAAAASICEHQIESVPRYRSGGTVTDEDDSQDVLNAFGAAMGGAIFMSGGVVTCRAGAPVTATITLTDSDLAGPVEFMSAPRWRETPNALRVSFTDPGRFWQQNQTAPITSSTYVTEDGGEVHEDEFPCFLVNHPDCANRIGRLRLAELREPRRVSAPFKAKAFKLKEGRTCTVDLARFGINEKMFVESRSLQANGTVHLVLGTETDAKYGAADDFNQPLPTFATIGRANASFVPTPDAGDWSAEGVTLEDPTGGSKQPSVRVFGDVGNRLVVSALIEWSPAALQEWQTWAEIDLRKHEPVETTITGVPPQSDLQVRIRYRTVWGVTGRPNEALILNVTTLGEHKAFESGFSDHAFDVAAGGALEAALDVLAAGEAALADGLAAEEAARIAADEALEAGIALLETAGYQNFFRDPLLTLGDLTGYGSNGNLLYLYSGDGYRGAGVEKVAAGAGEELRLVLPGRFQVKAGTRLQAAVEIEETVNVGDLKLQVRYSDEAGDPTDPAVQTFDMGASGRLAGFAGAPVPDDAVRAQYEVTAESAGAGEARFAVSHLVGAYAGSSDTEVPPFVGPQDEQVAKVLDYRRVEIAGAYQLQGLSWEAGEQRSLVIQTQTAVEGLAQKFDSVETALGTDIATAFSLLQSEITSLDGDVSALSTAVIGVEAQVGEATADGLLVVQAGASPGGASSAIAMRVRATSGGSSSESGLYLTPSGVVVDAPKFTILSGGSLVAAFSGGAFAPALIPNLAANKITSGELNVGSGGITIRSAASGERIVIGNSMLQVFNPSNVEKVRLGVW